MLCTVPWVVKMWYILYLWFNLEITYRCTVKPVLKGHSWWEDTCDQGTFSQNRVLSSHMLRYLRHRDTCHVGTLFMWFSETSDQGTHRRCPLIRGTFICKWDNAPQESVPWRKMCPHHRVPWREVLLYLLKCHFRTSFTVPGFYSKTCDEGTLKKCPCMTGLVSPCSRYIPNRCPLVTGYTVLFNQLISRHGLKAPPPP